MQHFNSIVGKLQNVAVKRPVVTPLAPRRDNSVQQTYAASAARTTYTSMTQSRDTSTAANTSSSQTTTESVVVIEQYEQRFVSIENMCQENATRISRVEVSTSTTANMVRRLLIHSGIPLDAEMEENTADTSLLTGTSGSGRMDIDHEGVVEGGTKRQCQLQQFSPSNSSEHASNRY